MSGLRCLLLLTIVAVPAAILADDSRGPAQPGRYSITANDNKLYLLDTATGEIWYWAIGEWHELDSPVHGRAKAKPDATLPVKLTLPKSGVAMPMEQRERRAVPGSDESIEVRIGDITGAQVFVEVVDVNGRTLLERASLKDDEFAKFEVNGKTVYLQVTGMVNNLFGEDICQVRLTHKKPRVKREPRDSAEPRDEAK